MCSVHSRKTKKATPSCGESQRNDRLMQEPGRIHNGGLKDQRRCFASYGTDGPWYSSTSSYILFSIPSGTVLPTVACIFHASFSPSASDL